MRRSFATLAVVALCVASLRADVRVTSTTTVEGGFAAMMGGMTPRVVMHIKGTKARAEMDLGQTAMATITDLSTQQVTVLNHAQKTAQVVVVGAPPPGTPPMVMPKFDADIQPTGRTQTIAGNECAEHTLKMSVAMADAAASPQMPPEASAMMKDLRMVMSGTMWVAKSGPGVAEYAAFQAAAVKAGVGKMMAAIPGMGSSGIDRMMSAFSTASGLPYLTEMSMTFEGSGPVVEMMKQQGPIKITTKVTEVSTDPLSDDLFKVPEDYKVVK